MPPPHTLADLDSSPEARIFARVGELLRADALLADCFKPIRLIETPSREAFVNYGQGSLAVQPFSVKAEDHPSKRSTSFFGVMVSAFLPNEQTEEDSALIGLDLGGHLRALLWGFAVLDSGVQISFATTSFQQLAPLISVDGATRILSYQAIFETDIDPTQNDFTA